MKTKILSRSDIEAVVLQSDLNELLDTLIDKLAEAFSLLGQGKAIIPPRTGIQYMNPGLGLIEWMPATLQDDCASLKLVAYHPNNPQNYALPTVISSICIFDTRSGHLKSMLDGTFLTALRTGAMSAIATRELANPTSKILGIVGCGAQAVTQIHALSRILPLETILAYDTDPSAVASLADRIPFLQIPIVSVEKKNLNGLLQEADVLCTCTSETPGQGPLFPDFDHKPWLHINAVGSDFPEKFELPRSLLQRAFICPDFREQAIAEGECQQIDPKQIGYELSELMKRRGETESLRENLSVFDSTGHALADYVVGDLFLSRATELDLGTEIEIECLPQNPKNPYSFLSTDACKLSGPSTTLSVS